MSDIISVILSYIWNTFGVVGVGAILFIIAWLFYPEKVEKALLLCRKILAYISKKQERRYIAKHIETNINQTIKNMSKISEDISPYTLKVEWVDSENVESELKEGVLILKMQNHRNQSKNLALAVWEFVQQGIIPASRVYVHPELMKGIDYTVSKAILSEADTRALSFFQNFPEIMNYLNQESIKNKIYMTDKIHSQGYLLRILLPEYSKLSIHRPLEPSPEIHEETLKFAETVYKLVSKGRGVDVNTTLNGNYIKAAIVPVARSQTIDVMWTDAHLHFIKKSLMEGISSFYIVSIGKNNKIFAENVVDRAVQELGLRKVFAESYEGVYQNSKHEFYCAKLEKR